MPNYNANNQITPQYETLAGPPILDENVPFAAFNAESPAAGQASQQVCLPRSGHGVPKSISVSIHFSADPGAFQIDLQTADTDAAANYVTEQSITAGLNASFTTRAELTSVVANWLRAVAVLVTNSVTTTVIFTRHY